MNTRPRAAPPLPGSVTGPWATVPPRYRSRAVRRVLWAGLLTAAACSDGPTGDADARNSEVTCTIPTGLIHDVGFGRSGIPTLVDPQFVDAEPKPENAYLKDDDRVLGVLFDGRPMAIPHNIMWYHEIANLHRDSGSVAVTYCPLTGSYLGFDRTSIGGDQLGVSGLLFMNNLMMFNRGEPEALWPQMTGQAACGDGIGRTIDRFPVFEMTWLGWRSMHPETVVVSSDVNISRDYTLYPYGDHESLDNETFFFPMPPLDRRRPAKERVLGLPPVGPTEPGIAFPFLALEDEASSWATVEVTWNGEEIVTFWSTQYQGAAAFRPFHPVTGERLEFTATVARGIEDTATGTRWNLTGAALDGPHEGARLEPVAEAYVAFWGAWAAFFPETRLWEG